MRDWIYVIVDNILSRLEDRVLINTFVHSSMFIANNNNNIPLRLRPSSMSGVTKINHHYVNFL